MGEGRRQWMVEAWVFSPLPCPLSMGDAEVATTSEKDGVVREGNDGDEDGGAESSHHPRCRLGRGRW